MLYKIHHPKIDCNNPNAFSYTNHVCMPNIIWFCPAKKGKTKEKKKDFLYAKILSSYIRHEGAKKKEEEGKKKLNCKNQ